MEVGLGFIALSIASSRILLGMHFLSDVVAGALIGSALGYCSYAIFGLKIVDTLERSNPNAWPIGARRLEFALMS
jgi:membrane-associated phospholipid phosphatase